MRARASASSATALAGWAADAGLARARRATLVGEWNADRRHGNARGRRRLPSDAQVLGAVNRALGKDATVVCAAGGLPGELHKLWRAADADGYHLEYGYSCMGYEIAGGLGVKLADPDARRVVVLVGDGSYLMMNSEIATSVALGSSSSSCSRQPRLWLHQPPAGGLRRRTLQQPADDASRRRRRSISSRTHAHSAPTPRR